MQFKEFTNLFVNFQIVKMSQIKLENTAMLSSSVSGLCNHIKLQKLIIEESNVTDIHLKFLSTLFPLLKTLQLSWNKFISMEGWQHIVDTVTIAKENKLESLILSYCNITDHNLHALCGIIPMLTTFSLRYNKAISPTGWKYFSEVISNEITLNLKIVILCDCNIDDLCLRRLREVIPLFQTMDLSWNKLITTVGWGYISNKICAASERNIKVIKLAYCNINDGGVEAMSGMIPLVTEINLSGNKHITRDGLLSISDVIVRENHCCLQNLIIRDCNLVDTGLRELCKIIPLLKNIDLSYNTNITTVGWKNLSDTIRSTGDNKLETIRLENCKLTDSDILVMDMFLLLREISLCENRITAVSIEHVLKSIRAIGEDKINLKLQKIELKGCNIWSSCKELQELSSVVQVDIRPI